MNIKKWIPLLTGIIIGILLLIIWLNIACFGTCSQPSIFDIFVDILIILVPTLIGLLLSLLKS